VLTMQERFGTDGIVNDGAVYVSGKHMIEIGSITISRRSPDGDGVNHWRELLPYASRYHQTWDDEPLVRYL
jgi:hypothetical protein